jgi:hypothetical protein
MIISRCSFTNCFAGIVRFTRGRPKGRFNPAGFSFAFAGRGKLLTLPFAMLLERARKSGGPSLLEPSFKVQRNTAHNQSSGFAVAPGFKGLNARGPLKVHPEWHSLRRLGLWQRLEESALAPRAVAAIDRPMTASEPNPHRRPSWTHGVVIDPADAYICHSGCRHEKRLLHPAHRRMARVRSV